MNHEILSKHKVVDWGYTTETKAKSFKQFRAWVENNEHLPLHYLSGERAKKREDLKNYDSHIQSALCFLFSYREEKEKWSNDLTSHKNLLKTAGYAVAYQGLDYHYILRGALNDLALAAQKKWGSFEYKISLDTQPILERDLAYRAGLGWFGKNSMLIHPQHGSYFLLGSLLIDRKLDIPSRSFETDHCGQCTRCIDLCPTKAIDPVKRTLNSKQCISTWTIEDFKGELDSPQGMNEQDNWFFGCDICQEVCPWNQRLNRINPVKEEFTFNETAPSLFKEIILGKADESYNVVDNISGKSFQKQMKGTVLERPGKKGILKNLKWLLRNKRASD